MRSTTLESKYKIQSSLGRLISIYGEKKIYFEEQEIETENNQFDNNYFPKKKPNLLFI